MLYPVPLRDTLLTLAEAGLYRAKWTDQIHDEWTRNVLKNRDDVTKEKLERTRQCMNNAILDCLVTGYEDLIESLTATDAKDRHVVAAAIRANADIIVTANLKDFDVAELKKYQIYAEHPDEFVSNMMELSTPEVLDAMREQRARLINPPLTVDEFLASLLRQEMPQTVNMLRKYAGSI